MKILGVVFTFFVVDTLNKRFNKPKILFFTLVPMYCTFVPSVKDNGGERRESGTIIDYWFETFHEIIYGKSDAAQTSAAFFLPLPLLFLVQGAISLIYAHQPVQFRPFDFLQVLISSLLQIFWTQNRKTFEKSFHPQEK